MSGPFQRDLVCEVCALLLLTASDCEMAELVDTRTYDEFWSTSSASFSLSLIAKRSVSCYACMKDRFLTHLIMLIWKLMVS